jgi:hypothetical protein
MHCYSVCKLNFAFVNLIQEEIKRRLNSGNACYHSVQNLLSSRLLSKNVKMTIYKTITLPVVLYGCETWSLTLREEHRLRVFENRVLRGIFGPKLNEVVGGIHEIVNIFAVWWLIKHRDNCTLFLGSIKNYTMQTSSSTHS